jgi:nitroimidazol reductase NimA-like FMN-containing flavoprotein (pyridoxamine 5'-phosphate oxidase superfamily)
MAKKTAAATADGGEPQFRDLSTEESEALLARNHVGRIAFSFHDSVDIRPIHYVYDEGWLFGRTSPSDKLIVLQHNQWVAFEIDEISGPFDWSSVIVRGTFYRLQPEGSVHDVKLHGRGMKAIRTLSPAALTEKDVVAFRTELFGVTVDSISGRTCSTQGSAIPPSPRPARPARPKRARRKSG